MLMSVAQTADRLGVSRRMVYDLAAPGGPIPCHRIGGRILFSPDDVAEYLQQCRYTETKNAVVSSLSSTASLRANESELEKYFRKRGREPKRTPSTVKSQRGSTPLQLVSQSKTV